MDFPKDLEEATKLKWVPYAGRNLSYFVTSTYIRDTYGKLYEEVLGTKFQYIFVEARGKQWQMYRSPLESGRLEKYVYDRLGDKDYVKAVFDKIESSYAAY
ncbi:hypothetical protein HZC09_02735 [Candidatus Micrarchaeota archaeon]|nr:hypothetical protein [Candidatus Micrarchaeota archaeon]